MATENQITLHRAHEIVAAFHRKRADEAALDKVRDDHNRTADDLEDWLMVHGSNPRWHVALDGAPAGEIITGVQVGFDGLASAAMRLLAWHDRDDEFVTLAAEECAESGLTSVQFERELWEALRGALAAEGMPDAGAVYDRRRRDAQTAAIVRFDVHQGGRIEGSGGRGGEGRSVAIGDGNATTFMPMDESALGEERARTLSLVSAVDGVGAAMLVSTRTRPAFVAGNFAQRLREALEICAMAIDDRRRLIIETPAAMVRALEREPDWAVVPACFKGDARIVGSFAGVPVRQEFNTTGALILFAGEIVGVVRGGDQTPEESERRGEAERGA